MFAYVHVCSLGYVEFSPEFSWDRHLALVFNPHDSHTLSMYDFFIVIHKAMVLRAHLIFLNTRVRFSVAQPQSSV